MANSNCLAGMRCPKCGSYGWFSIHGKALFVVDDDGSSDFTGLEWEDSSFCACSQCDFEGKVRDFKEKK